MTAPETLEQVVESLKADPNWGPPKLTSADLSQRSRLIYIKGAEREALETALWWQQAFLRLSALLPSPKAITPEENARDSFWCAALLHFLGKGIDMDLLSQILGKAMEYRADLEAHKALHIPPEISAMLLPSPAPQDLRSAAEKVIEWYDRDGSVGGLGDPIDALRAALSASLPRSQEGEG